MGLFKIGHCMRSRHIIATGFLFLLMLAEFVSLTRCLPDHGQGRLIILSHIPYHILVIRALVQFDRRQLSVLCVAHYIHFSLYVIMLAPITTTRLTDCILSKCEAKCIPPFCYDPKNRGTHLISAASFKEFGLQDLMPTGSNQ